MSLSTFFALLSVSLGFVAGCLFCVGSVLNAPSSILSQASPYWDFNRHLAKSLAAQRAQYVVGAVFLVLSFALQLGATLSSVEAVPWLPGSWAAVVLTTLLLASALAGLVVRGLIRKTYREVQRLKKRREAKDAELKAAAVAAAKRAVA